MIGVACTRLLSVGATTEAGTPSGEHADHGPGAVLVSAVVTAGFPSHQNGAASVPLLAGRPWALASLLVQSAFDSVLSQPGITSPLWLMAFFRL